MLASAALMTACGNESATEEPTEAPTEAPTEEQPEIIPETPYPVDRLTVAGTPIDEFVIVRNPNGGETVEYAAAELQEYIATTCGATLEIVDTAEPGAKRFLLDETAYDGTNDNFKYYSDTDGIVFEGAAKRSIIYCIYNFLEKQLGWRFFAADCETCKEVSAIDVADVNFEQDFVYDIRAIYWTDYFGQDISLKRYQNGETKRDSILGGCEHFHPHGIHTFWVLAGNSSEGDQPCLNDENVYQTMYKNIKERLLGDPSTKAIHISQNDNERYCQCDECLADIEYYGSPAGTIIEFLNRVDENLKADGLTDITLITFAYRYSFPCPKNITCNDDIAIELCTITSCYNHAFNDASCPKNADAMKQIDAWGEICDEFYVWDYTVNFSYYLSPFANFDVLLENIKYLGETGGIGYIAQGNYQQGASAEFADLRCYLIAKVLEDPYMTKEEYYSHMDEFLAAYYGDAASYVRKFIDLVTDMSNAKNECFDIYSSPEIMYGDHAFEPYNEILLEWWDNAEAAVADDPVILQHVRRSRLCCDYLRIGAIHHQAYDVRDAMRDTVNAFHEELKELGIKRIAEGYALPDRVGKDTNPRNWWGLHYYQD